MFSLDEYRLAVEFFASRHRDFDIKNEGNDCARVVLTNLFLNARHRIRMVAHTLRNEVVDANEYQDSLDSFLARKDARLQVVIHHLPEIAKEVISSNLYRRLRFNPAYEEGRIEIKVAGRDRFFIGDKPVNFCVADGMMYRLENDIDRRIAICNFGNKKRAEELESVFDHGYESIKETVNLKELFS